MDCSVTEQFPLVLACFCSLTPQATSAVPPARVARTLMDGLGGSAGVGRPAAGTDDVGLQERLAWLGGWAEEAAGRDSDENCRQAVAR